MTTLVISLIWFVVCLAIAFNAFMFFEVIKGIARSQWDRVDRELREILTGKQNFLVPSDE